MNNINFNIGDLFKTKNKIIFSIRAGRVTDSEILYTIDINEELLILNYDIYNVEKNSWFEIMVLHKNTIGWIGVMKNEIKKFFEVL